MSSASKKPLPESAVLIPRDPSITNSDDWPEFRLTNATVTRPSLQKTATSTGEPVSLLLAGEHNPLTITGQLEPLPKGQTHRWLAKPHSRPLTIQVSDVVSYSYGAYQDGSVELWAAGKAGWFVVRPSQRYQHTYEEMIEAVKILFFIVDAYTTTRKSGKGKNATILPDFTAQEVFEKYAIEVMGVAKGAPEAAKKIYKHREFLLSSMIDGKEGLTWGKNALYMHLCRKFAAEVKEIRARKAAEAAEKKKVVDQEKETEMVTKVAPTTHTRQGSLDSASATSSLKRKRGRPPKSADVISISSSAATEGEGIETKAAQKGNIASQAPATKRASKTKTSRQTRSNPTPTNSEIPESQPTTPAATQESDSEVPYDRRKSALRLKPNKPTKGPPKQSSKLALATADEDDENDDESQPDPPARVSGNKRKREETTRVTKPVQRTTSNTRSHRTRSRLKQSTSIENVVDEGIDIPTSPSASPSSPASDDAIAGAASTDLPIHSLLRTADPLQQNVWVCALDGCSHKVYGPSASAEVQKLIREHYGLHAYDDDDRVRMVKGMAEPSLPINYLVERVRGQVRLEGLGGAVGTGKDWVGTRFPEPLRTKY